MSHPWRELRAMPHVDVVWTDQLPVRVRAATDGRTIWMATGLVQRERRSSLAHELEHIRRGHRGCQPPAVEDAVRACAARRLLPDIVDVADGLVWAQGHLDVAAEELWVDRVTLRYRVDPSWAPRAEVAYLSRRLHDVGQMVRLGEG